MTEQLLPTHRPPHAVDSLRLDVTPKTWAKNLGSRAGQIYVYNVFATDPRKPNPGRAVGVFIPLAAVEAIKPAAVTQEAWAWFQYLLPDPSYLTLGQAQRWLAQTPPPTAMARVARGNPAGDIVGFVLPWGVWEALRDQIPEKPPEV